MEHLLAATEHPIIELPITDTPIPNIEEAIWVKIDDPGEISRNKR